MNVLSYTVTYKHLISQKIGKELEAFDGSSNEYVLCEIQYNVLKLGTYFIFPQDVDALEIIHSSSLSIKDYFITVVISRAFKIKLFVENFGS